MHVGPANPGSMPSSAVHGSVIFHEELHCSTYQSLKVNCMVQLAGLLSVTPHLSLETQSGTEFQPLNCTLNGSLWTKKEVQAETNAKYKHIEALCIDSYLCSCIDEMHEHQILQSWLCFGFTLCVADKQNICQIIEQFNCKKDPAFLHCALHGSSVASYSRTSVGSWRLSPASTVTFPPSFCAVNIKY